jgi:hypothetical protein
MSDDLFYEEGLEAHKARVKAMEYMQMQTYKIVRNYLNGRPRVIERGLTLEQAQAHCQDPETSSSTCQLARNVRRTQTQGPWFDGYDQE